MTRADYIRAVHCLAAKPPLMDKRLAPGAVNRLDDFTYIHINQTNIIHQSVRRPSECSLYVALLMSNFRVISFRGIAYSSGRLRKRFAKNVGTKDISRTGTSPDSPKTSPSRRCLMGQ